MADAEGRLVTLAPGKSDAEAAAEIRAEAGDALKRLCDIMDRAKAAGLAVTFRIGPDQFGRNVVQEIAVVRPL
jgi:hypothetical protein